MFERLINSFGLPANQHEVDDLIGPELQLATAQLLFAALPVDYVVTPHEGLALAKSLKTLFGFSKERCQRMIARAASAHSRDSNIMAAATMLKNRTSLSFRRRLMVEIHLLVRADGVLHENELDLEQRLERLLGLFNSNQQKIA